MLVNRCVRSWGHSDWVLVGTGVSSWKQQGNHFLSILEGILFLEFFSVPVLWGLYGDDNSDNSSDFSGRCQLVGA